MMHSGRRIERDSTSALANVSPTILAALGSELDALTSTLARVENSFRGDLTLLTLATKPLWVAWREEDEKGIPVPAGSGSGRRPKKVPRDPHTRRRARSNDASTWGTRASAEAAASSLLKPGCRGGVGIQLSALSGSPKQYLCGIDLDTCLEPSTGELSPDAQRVLSRFQSYTEISPSGTGLKVFFLLDAADFGRTLRLVQSTGGKGQRRSWSKGEHEEIALDLPNRYYTVTDNHFAGTPAAIHQVDLQSVEWLFDKAGPEFVSGGLEASRLGHTVRDESGSGYGYRFFLEQVRLEQSLDRAERAIKADCGSAGEWARRVDDRQIRRAWEGARSHIDAEREALDSVFADDDEEDRWSSVADPIITRLNQRHAHVMINGKARIITFQPDGSLVLSAVPDLHSLYANDRVMLGKKLVPASFYWMLHPKRRSYPNGLSFSFEGNLPGTYNQWSGWAVKPDPSASCELFLQHLQEVICAGSKQLYDYLVGWLAHLVQRPGDKPGVALVIRGPKGAGKDTVAEYLVRVIGRRHAPTVADATHLVGRFNARMEQALLLQVQEGFWAGDKKAEGVLKYLVTSETLEIERKGIDSYSAPNFTRILITANAEWVVPASSDERRWAVLEASGHRCIDRGYFDELHAELKGGGPAALLSFLMNHDLSRFDVRSAPASLGLAAQKIASLKNLDAWCFDLLSTGEVEVEAVEEKAWSETSLRINRSDLYARYESWLRNRRFEGDPVDKRRFGIQIRRLLGITDDSRPATKDGSRPRYYQIPKLAEARRVFELHLKAEVDWSSLPPV